MKGLLGLLKSNCRLCLDNKVYPFNATIKLIISYGIQLWETAGACHQPRLIHTVPAHLTN